MIAVSGRYFGEIDFTGRIMKTTVINGKMIHDIQLSSPITSFGDFRTQILVEDKDLIPSYQESIK